jgi:hypothetical protein
LIDLATSLGIELMEWQKFALIHTHKVKPDGGGQAQSTRLSLPGKMENHFCS